MDISVIGGDLRIVRLVEMYEAENDVLYTFGLEKYFESSSDQHKNLDNSSIKNIVLCDSIKEAMEHSKVIISGMPFPKDEITVNAPFAKNKINIQDVKKELDSKIFIAGGIPKDFYSDNITNIDLLKDEALTILNAIPTVEGTIKIAIEQREETIHESNVLVCGFGRIGKILCDRFKALGANVYCAARKDSDFAWIREKSYIPIKYNEICEYATKFNIVINTVPSLVITKKELDCFGKDVLIIDVASNPGGIDKVYSEKLGINLITALGIPGKELPKSAGRYIKERIDALI